MSSVEVEIDGRRLTLTNLEKVLYPAAGFRKAEVIDYYHRIAPILLPHLAGRALTLVRAPNGPDGQIFFEKRCPPHHPSWVPVAEEHKEAGGTPGCLVEDVPTVVWLANLAALELHTQQWRIDDWRHPTAVVFDLDPGAPATILDCCRVARELREVLHQFELEMVVKTSGSKGLHLSIPLGTGAGRRADADETKRFSLALGQLMEQRDPKRITTNMAKEQRGGRVFVDWSQNDRHKTTVAAYSLRVRPRPWVSTPVTWDEVEDALEGGDTDALVFEPADVLARVESEGDHYAPNVTLDQQLPSLQA